ncbi:hypothetical protein BGW80DRAFT_1459494 [Lactifluus volemus]|nr:hypothetical protein BGW80DRAFT_1459494 [Lactifluus volemus]
MSSSPVTLVFWRKESPLNINVLATDQIGDLQISTWPTILELVLTGPAVPITEFQGWMKTTNPATARFQPASRTDDYNFGLLVKSLRENRCYVTASWEIQGKGHPTTNLLFVPFAQDILCAAFPASGIPYLPTPPTEAQKQNEALWTCPERQPTRKGKAPSRWTNLDEHDAAPVPIP